MLVGFITFGGEHPHINTGGTMIVSFAAPHVILHLGSESCLAPDFVSFCAEKTFCVCLKIKQLGLPQVLVFVSIDQGAILGTSF